MTKNTKWFIKKRGSYLPKTWQSGLLYLAYLSYLIWVLIYALTSNYDILPAIFILLPNWIAACAVMSWIASKKS